MTLTRHTMAWPNVKQVCLTVWREVKITFSMLLDNYYVRIRIIWKEKKGIYFIYPNKIVHFLSMNLKNIIYTLHFAIIFCWQSQSWMLYFNVFDLISFVINVSRLILLYCLVSSLQPCDHLLGKGWPPSSLVCYISLCFCHFLIWCRRSGVIDCINSWSVPSSALSWCNVAAC